MARSATWPRDFYVITVNVHWDLGTVFIKIFKTELKQRKHSIFEQLVIERQNFLATTCSLGTSTCWSEEKYYRHLLLRCCCRILMNLLMPGTCTYNLVNVLKLSKLGLWFNATLLLALSPQDTCIIFYNSLLRHYTHNGITLCMLSKETWPIGLY